MAREERAACHHLQMTFQNGERSDAGLLTGQVIHFPGRLFVTRHFNCLTDCSITANSILKFIDISYYSVLVFTARFFLPLLTQLEMSIMLS